MKFKLTSFEKYLATHNNDVVYRLHFTPCDKPEENLTTLHPGNLSTSFRDGFVLNSYDEPYAKRFNLGHVYSLELAQVPETILPPQDTP